jgi:hypothetical protein
MSAESDPGAADQPLRVLALAVTRAETTPQIGLSPENPELPAQLCEV